MSHSNLHWFEVCHLDDIPLRGAVRVEQGGKRIALFKSLKNEVFAVEDSCPHQGGPLSDGIVHGDCVTCPLHNWNINLKSGLVVGDDEGSVETFDVRLVDNLVYVRMKHIIAIAG